jgi:hypothetical protein
LFEGDSVAFFAAEVDGCETFKFFLLSMVVGSAVAVADVLAH